MSALLVIAKVIIASGILFSYYWLFLRNKRFHHYNRFYLLSALVIPPLFSLISIPIFLEGDHTTGSVLFKTVTAITIDADDASAAGVADTRESFDWKYLLGSIYIIISATFLTLTVRAIRYIQRLRRRYPFESLHDLKLYTTTEPGTPFSFFQSIFWHKEIIIESKQGQQILRHELFHVQQKHSVDILLAEALTALFWINPFYHLIKKELKAIHEFLADQHAASHDNKGEYAELLLQRILQTRTLPVTNYFFQNHIKRRIAMITQLKNKKYGYGSRLMVLPLTVLLFCGIALYARQSPAQQNKQLPAENKLDAPLQDTIPPKEKERLQKELKELQERKTKLIEENQKEVEKLNARQFELRKQLYKDKVIETEKSKVEAQELRELKAMDVETKKLYEKQSLLREQQLNEQKRAYELLLQQKMTDKELMELKKQKDKGYKTIIDKELQLKLDQLEKIKAEDARSQKQNEKELKLILEKVEDLQEKVMETEKGIGKEKALLLDKIKEERIMLDEREKRLLNEQMKEQKLLAEKSYDKNGDPDGLVQDDKVFVKAERSPLYPGGQEGWLRYIQTNGKIPTDGSGKKATGEVAAQFIVDQDGNVSKIETSGGTPEMRMEVERLIENSGKWSPAIQNGHKVKAYKKLSVTFSVKGTVYPTPPKVDMKEYKPAPNKQGV